MPARLALLYARVPTITCRGLCHEACGPILMSRIEWERLCAAAGRVPTPTAEQARRLTCPLLGADKRCEVYADRPLICRLFGVAEGLECPHGCVPESLLTRAEAGALLDEADALAAAS